MCPQAGSAGDGREASLAGSLLLLRAADLSAERDDARRLHELQGQHLEQRMSDAAAQQRALPGSQPEPAAGDRGQPSQGFNPFSDPRAAGIAPCWGSSAVSAAEPQQSAAGPAGGRQEPAALPSEEALGRPLLPRERALRRLAAMRCQRGLPTAEQALAHCQVGLCCGHHTSCYPLGCHVLHAVGLACVCALRQPGCCLGVHCVRGAPLCSNTCARECSDLAALAHSCSMHTPL